MKNIRKGKKIHFLNSDTFETIIFTKNAKNRVDGELKTDKKEYSVHFIRTWEELGFLKII